MERIDEIVVIVSVEDLLSLLKIEGLDLNGGIWRSYEEESVGGGVEVDL